VRKSTEELDHGQELEREKLPFLVIEDRHELVEKLRANGIEAIHGNGAAPEVIAAANLGGARLLLVAIPDAFEAGQISCRMTLGHHWTVSTGSSSASI
jgi:Trk K+ transport system NAD-binding subunit